MLDLQPTPQNFINQLLSPNRNRPVLKKNGEGESFLSTGNRNSGMAQIAGSMRAKGLSIEQIEAGLLGVNETIKDPLPETEVRQIAHSIGKYDVKAFDFITNQGFANLFVCNYMKKIRYCESIGFFVFSGVRWEEDVEGLRVTRLQTELADKLFSDLILTKDKVEREDYDKKMKVMSKLKDAAFLSKSLKLVKSDERIFMDVQSFVPSPNHLNFRNGTLDLETLKLKPHDPKDNFRHVLDFDYDPLAKCQTFDSVLSSALPSEHSEFFLRIMGYALAGTGREQKMFFFIGGGQNGKSTLVEAVSDLFGQYAVTLQAESLTGKMDGQIRCDLIRLDGAYLEVVLVRWTGWRRF